MMTGRMEIKKQNYEINIDESFKQTTNQSINKLFNQSTKISINQRYVI